MCQCTSLIENLKFENFYVTVTKFISGQCLLKNCILSGRAESYLSNLSIFSGVGLHECAVNIKCVAADTLTFISSGGFSNSEACLISTDLVVDISCEKCSFLDTLVRNSRITGKIQTNSSSFSVGSKTTSAANVISLESNAPITYSGKSISVYNSDLASVLESSGATKLEPCTAEQLKNAAYLYSVGFPVGID